jgi:hypothetical protein
VTRYGQTDTLVTSTDVTMSGTGTATPEGAAGNADYSGWPWEVILATVLGIGAPDRSEVVGQPWLTTQVNGQGAAGSHLIWSAGWDTGADGAGASSIQVYLSPGLYTAGGAWDTFLTAPATALAGVPGQDYTGLPLSPPSFQAASGTVIRVSNWLASATDHLAALHAQAASGPAAGFQGEVADVATELLGDLRASVSAMNEQMTSPESYGVSIGMAGDAASQFLSNLMSAYLAWTQVPAHSPLGAVVQVLENIAALDSGGASIIADPQNTPFGDLTSPDAWPAVEQQAKSLWTGLLTGESPGFAGLDPQARFALGRLTSQFAATSATLVPVVGPGLSTTQPQARPGFGSGLTGTPAPAQPSLLTAGSRGQASNGPQAGAGANLGAGAGAGAGVAAGAGPGAGPGLSAGPDAGPVGLAAAGQAGAHGGAPVPAGVPLALVATGPAAAATAADPAAAAPAVAGADSALTDLASPSGPASAQIPATDLAAVPGTSPLAAAVPGPGGAAGAGPGPAGAEDVAADSPGLASALAQPGVLAGAIGATAGDRADDAARPRTDLGGFTGTIGHPPEAGHKDGGPAPHGVHRKKALPAGLRQAPAAGYSLGRDPGGSVLPQAAVPTVTARPTGVVSSPVNAQLTPGAGALGGAAPGGTAPPPSASAGAPGGTAATVPAGGTAAGGPAASTGAGAPDAPAGVAGEQAMLGRGATGGATPGGTMTMPPGGPHGGAGQAGGQERMRHAYLPEDADSWGAGPGPAGVVLGAGQHDEQDQHGEHHGRGEDAEPEFVPMASAAVGLGAQPDQARVAEEI